ncbi:outer membrane porin OpcP [Caballeronia hypogeia]|uniref:Outer membrane porin OpcP n=1 Tax=Caballeronia hypogeia TaxID=1777140 RepID=A0A158BRH9_9BURK|nr:porin [Caballeronia hypogeia]SAK72709.1 outer membrane porin OpcP [Caballeronia hypogeia]
MTTNGPRRILIAVALASCVSAAQAQSSVTLYGIIDEGLNFTTNANGQHQYALQSGVTNGSRWGLRGTEDLGGGLKAIFVLESGFDINNGKLGQGGLLFGRQAYVGLGNPYGTVTLGRQYDPNADLVGPFAASNQWAGNIGAHPADVDNLNNANRTNNSIKFKSATFKGVSLEAAYSLGGVAGDPTRNQIWSVAAAYSNGPAALAVGYLNVRNPNLSFFGNATTGTPSATTANTNYPIFSGFLSAHTYQAASAGGSYAFGPATAGVTYSNIAFNGLGDTSSGPNPNGYRGDVHFNNVEGNFRIFATPYLLIGVAYDYTKGSSVSGAAGVNDGATYHQAMAGVDYFLSKRTDVYLLGIYQKASGTDSRNRTAVASITNQSPSDNDRQAVVRVGLRHRF